MVKDKNDNAPVFPHERYLGFVYESANVTTYIKQVQASDKDGTEVNNEISYRLQVCNIIEIDSSLLSLFSLSCELMSERSQYMHTS